MHIISIVIRLPNGLEGTVIIGNHKVQCILTVLSVLKDKTQEEILYSLVLERCKGWSVGQFVKMLKRNGYIYECHKGE